MINKIKQNRGQVAVMVLIVSAILLSLGLSASKKAVIDTKVDTDEELLKEAFNVAESGINNYINNGVVTYSDNSGNNASIGSSDIGGGTSTSLSSEGVVTANTSQLFWLVNHKDDGSIGDVYYASNFDVEVTDFNGALKVDYFYIDGGGNYKVERLGCRYDDGNGNAAFDNGFNDTCTNLSIDGRRPLLVVVTPLGGSTEITISGDSTFPIQGQQLTSVGTAGDGVKTQIKTRNVYQIPLFFTEAITARKIIQ